MSSALQPACDAVERAKRFSWGIVDCNSVACDRLYRIAFVTPEYVSEYTNGGGLGNYLHRTAKLLCEMGHSPEIFVPSDATETISHNGILVHRVRRFLRTPFWHLHRMLSRTPMFGDQLESVVSMLADARSLAMALRARERIQPFDLVQSASFRACGTFVGRSKRRPHVIRCSSAADLLAKTDQRRKADTWRGHLERRAIRKADRTYAPSQCLSNHFRDAFGLQLDVLRPPFDREVAPAAEIEFDLPARFAIHFGQIRGSKGSELLAQSLRRVWDKAPDFHMIWAGTARREQIAAWAHDHQLCAERFRWVGALSKPELYHVLARSDFAVLPSLIDNLPNTGIESLTFDRPVVAFRGASMDELIADRQNGLLVEVGNVEQLADAMLKLWKRPCRFGEALLEKSPIYDELRPERAIANLLSLAYPVATRK